MYSKNLVAILFFFVIVSCEKEEENVKNAINYLAQLKTESESLGWTATVSSNGRIILSEGLGWGNVEQQVPVFPDKTKFRIGSISKSLTAAALGILIEEGKIELDAPVQKYVPDFPKKKYPITVRQVAGHIAGIRHYNGEEFLSANYYKTVSEGLEIFKNDSLLFEPGTRYNYSSYGFNLISAVIEGASGEDFLSFMKNHVFLPLEMNETVPDRNDSLIIYRSGFYSMENGKDINAPYVDNSYKWAGGGFLSSSEDLVKFGNAMLTNTLFSAAIKDLLITSQMLNNGTETGYGMGFFTGTDEFGRQYYGHGGGSIGGCGNLIIYPEINMVVAVITNDSRAKVGREIFKVAEILVGNQK